MAAVDDRYGPPGGHYRYRSVLTQLSCRRACGEGQRSVADIAGMLGFSAPSGFSHWYRKHYKTRPSTRRGRAPG